jgi:hypothetical protein
MRKRNAGFGNTARVLLGAGILVLSACASGHNSAPNAAILAAIPADLRMMGAESTWVAHGVGYELVTRSKLEILPLMSQLDDQSRFFTKMFGAEPARIVAAVRRVGPAGTNSTTGSTRTFPEASAPVPFDAGPVVELIVVRAPAKGQKPATEPEGFGASGPTARVVRGWLSARASVLTGKPAPAAAASASIDDPRVPAWAEDAIPGLAVPTGREDTTTARLAMQVDSLYPIHSFLTMGRPGVLAGIGRGGAPGTGGRGGAPGGAGGGGRGGGVGGNDGGMGGSGGIGGRRGGGGMGGMGGGGGSMGRGMPRGGNYPGTDGGRPNGPLAGGALFAAQALVFGRYLVVKEGPAFVGALVDAQIQSKSVAELFDNAQMVPRNLERLDIEFRRWLIDRAAHGR